VGLRGGGRKRPWLQQRSSSSDEACFLKTSQDTESYPGNGTTNTGKSFRNKELEKSDKEKTNFYSSGVGKGDSERGGRKETGLSM